MPATPFVLVIEGQAELGNVIRDVLTDEGYNVMAVRDQYGAVGVLRHQPVDLVVADLPAPEEGEGDPLREISTDFPDTPLITLVDDAADGIPFFGPWRRDGSRLFLPRPFRLDDLIAATRELAG